MPDNISLVKTSLGPNWLSLGGEGGGGKRNEKEMAGEMARKREVEWKGTQEWFRCG